jgi:hypothetical protein
MLEDDFGLHGCSSSFGSGGYLRERPRPGDSRTASP